MREALPVMHAFTMTDSACTFVGKGTKQAYLMVVSDADMCDAMKMVGLSFDAGDERLEVCAQFVCSLCAQRQ